MCVSVHARARAPTHNHPIARARAPTQRRHCEDVAEDQEQRPGGGGGGGGGGGFIRIQ